MSNLCKHNPKTMSFGLSLIIPKSFDGNQVLIDHLLLSHQFKDDSE